MVEANNKGFSKVCYYELLDVDRKAEKKVIEKAYKKAALKWHPDKNRDMDTTEKFQTIQEAYACLSNDQERAWYDSHRDQILRGKDVGDGMSEADCSYITKAKLDRYFESNVYAGFVKAEHGIDFFSIFGELFAKLDKEEEMEEEVGTQHEKAKEFGDENSTKEEVYAFYRDWEGFNSIKKFTYVDVYDPREAPNRRIKRLIENDNNKARNKERTKFNDKMRDLIAHIKTKDPRWIRFQAEEQRLKDERKREQDEEKRIKREQETERLRQYREELAEFYRKEEEEAIMRGDVEEVFEEEFRCQMCKKSFKKEGQLQNHLQSKQHKKMESKVQALKSELQLDEETEQANAAEQEEILARQKEQQARMEEQKAREALNEEGQSDSDPEALEIAKKLNKVTRGDAANFEELKDADLDDMDEWTHKAKKPNKKKKHEKNKAEKVQIEKVKAAEAKFAEKRRIELEKKGKIKKQSKPEDNKTADRPATAQKKGKAQAQEEDEKAESEESKSPIKDSEETKTAEPEESKTESNPQTKNADSDSSTNNEDSKAEDEPTQEVVEPAAQFQLNADDLNWDDDDGKKGKKKGKRGGGQQQQAQNQGGSKSKQTKQQPASAAAAAEPKDDQQEQDQPQARQQKGKKQKKRGDLNDKEEQHKCNVCNEVFPTRNKVMQHVKLTGHARAV